MSASVDIYYLRRYYAGINSSGMVYFGVVKPTKLATVHHEIVKKHYTTYWTPTRFLRPPSWYDEFTLSVRNAGAAQIPLAPELP